jgi:CBS domain-containing membrane protein
MTLIDAKIKSNIRQYILQSVYATIAIFLILFFLNIFTHAAIIVSLGASAFIIFIVPKSYFAQPRPFIGGYIVSIIIGCLFRYFYDIFSPVPVLVNPHMTFIAIGALAVGVAIFLMAIFNVEHPPAAGMALGLILNQWDYKTLVYVICAVILMSVAKRLLEKRMIDLI